MRVLPRPLCSSAVIWGMVYSRGLNLRHDKRRGSLPFFSSICLYNLSSLSLFLSSEEKNKEKEKGGDNSTDTTQGTRADEQEASEFSSQLSDLCSPFHPSPVQPG